MKRRIAMTLMLLCFASAAHAEPPIRLTPTVGGGGGRPLLFYCDSARFLLGLNVRHGDWIDAAGLLCGRVDNHGAGRTLVPLPEENVLFDGGGGTRSIGAGVLWGGQGGGPGSLRCSPDEIVAGARVQRTRNNFVGHIQLRCVSINTPSRPLRDGPSAGPLRSDRAAPVVIDCPQGTAAVGFHGGAGDYLDRFGLMCSEMEFLRPAVAIALSGDSQIMGASIQSGGKDVADRDAIRRCGQADCRVVMSERGRCIAVARSDHNGIWYGWAYGDDPAPLNGNAIASCERLSRPGTCAVVHSNCL